MHHGHPHSWTHTFQEGKVCYENMLMIRLRLSPSPCVCSTPWAWFDNTTEVFLSVGRQKSGLKPVSLRSFMHLIFSSPDLFTFLKFLPRLSSVTQTSRDHVLSIKWCHVKLKPARQNINQRKSLAEFPDLNFSTSGSEWRCLCDVSSTRAQFKVHTCAVESASPRPFPIYGAICRISRRVHVIGHVGQYGKYSACSKRSPLRAYKCHAVKWGSTGGNVHCLKQEAERRLKGSPW